MATIKNIKRTRNWSTRPENNVILAGHIWYVKKGEPYDLVQFSINELEKSYFWRECLCVPCDWSDAKVKKAIKAYLKKEVHEKDIKDYLWFITMGEKWGWD